MPTLLRIPVAKRAVQRFILASVLTYYSSFSATAAELTADEAMKRCESIASYFDEEYGPKPSVGYPGFKNWCEDVGVPNPNASPPYGWVALYQQYLVPGSEVLMAWAHPYLNSSFSISLSGLRQIEPEETLSATATVTNDVGQPVSGAIVQLKIEALPQSGGHHHGNDNDVLRRGKLSSIAPEIVAIQPTGPDGTFSFTFNASAAAGTYKIIASCKDHACTQKGPNTINVKVEGLVPLPPSENFFVEIGDTRRHPDNHYLTPEAVDKAQTLAYFYKDPFSNAPLLRFNDASLEWGGIFDLDGNWKPSHKEHRRGTVIDVRANRTPTAIPPTQYPKFRTLIRNKIGGDFLHESVGRPNEHFHVRFMGRRE